MTATFRGRSGRVVNAQLLDMDLKIDRQETNGERVTFCISNGEIEFKAAFSLVTDRFVHASEDNETDILMDEDGTSLEDYLNFYPPVFYTSDFGSFQAGTLFPPVESELRLFDLTRFEAVDWVTEGVDTALEFGSTSPTGLSIHDYFSHRLVNSEADVVFYDHEPGEMADFVAVTADEEKVRVALYHCKASLGGPAGERVEDAYEVCGQAAKGVRWANPRIVLEAITRRLGRASGGSRFDKGGTAAVQEILGSSNRRPVMFESVIVQPGLSKSQLGDRVGSLLAAADGFLYEFGRFTKLRVIGSA